MKRSLAFRFAVLSILILSSCGSGDDTTAPPTDNGPPPPPPNTPSYSGTFAVSAFCNPVCETLTFSGFPGLCKITVTSAGDFIVLADVNGTERVYANGGFNWNTKTGRGFGYGWTETRPIPSGGNCYAGYTLGAVLTFSDEDHFSGTLSYYRSISDHADPWCGTSCEGQCSVSGTRIE